MLSWENIFDFDYYFFFLRVNVGRGLGSDGSSWTPLRSLPSALFGTLTSQTSQRTLSGHWGLISVSPRWVSPLHADDCKVILKGCWITISRHQCLSCDFSFFSLTQLLMFIVFLVWITAAQLNICVKWSGDLFLCQSGPLRKQSNAQCPLGLGHWSKSPCWPRPACQQAPPLNLWFLCAGLREHVDWEGMWVQDCYLFQCLYSHVLDCKCGEMLECVSLKITFCLF